MNETEWKRNVELAEKRIAELEEELGMMQALVYEYKDLWTTAG